MKLVNIRFCFLTGEKVQDNLFKVGPRMFRFKVIFYHASSLLLLHDDYISDPI